MYEKTGDEIQTMTFDEPKDVLNALTSSMFANSKDQTTQENDSNNSNALYRINYYYNPMIIMHFLKKYDGPKRLSGMKEISFLEYYLWRSENSSKGIQDSRNQEEYLHVILDEELSKYIANELDPFEIYELLINNNTHYPSKLDIQIYPESIVQKKGIVSDNLYDLSSNYYFLKKKQYKLTPVDYFNIFDAPLISSISNFCRDHEKCSKSDRCCYPDQCTVLDICKKNFNFTLRNDSDVTLYFDTKVRKSNTPHWGIEMERISSKGDLKIHLKNSAFWSARLSLYAKFSLRDNHSNKGIHSIKFQTRSIVKPRGDGDNQTIEPIDRLSFTPQDAWYYELCTGLSFCSRISSFINSLDSESSILTEFWNENREEIFVKILSSIKELIINCPAHKWRIAVVENIIHSFNQHCINYLTNNKNIRLIEDLEECFEVIKNNNVSSEERDKVIKKIVDFGSIYFKTAFKMYYNNLHTKFTSNNQFSIKSDNFLSFIDCAHTACKLWYCSFFEQSCIADLLVKESDILFKRLDRFIDPLVEGINRMFLDRLRSTNRLPKHPLNKQFVARYFLMSFLARRYNTLHNYYEEGIDFEEFSHYLAIPGLFDSLSDSDWENIGNIFNLLSSSIENKVNAELFSDKFFCSFDLFLDQYLKSVFSSEKYLMFCKDNLIPISKDLNDNINDFLERDNASKNDYSDLGDKRNENFILFRKLHTILYPNGCIDFGF